MKVPEDHSELRNVWSVNNWVWPRISAQLVLPVKTAREHVHNESRNMFYHREEKRNTPLINESPQSRRS